MLAGADLKKVIRIRATGRRDDEVCISEPKDIEALAQCIKDHRVALVILDPISTRLGEAFDTYKNTPVRQGLGPMVKLCHEYRVAVLGISHFNKDEEKLQHANAKLGS